MSDKVKNKTVSILFRVTPKECEAIKSKAKKSGLSMSEFIRRSLNGQKITTAPPVDFYTLLWQIKRIGSNLDQLLRKLNTFGIAYSLDLERCEDDIKDMKRLLIETYQPGKGYSDGSNIDMGGNDSL